MKIIRAVAPYIHPGSINFKTAAYGAWVKTGGKTAKSHYPIRVLHGVVYQYDLPTVFKSKKEARLRFVEPVSIRFDTFPDYAHYEIIPFFWDCWPCYYDKIEVWLKKHDVKTAVFTSSQEMEEMKRRLPNINMLHCPEAVDTSLYKEGKPLRERTIDLLEFGRSNEKVIDMRKIKDLEIHGNSINHVATKVGDSFIYENKQLYEAMGNAKTTICLPKNMTHPQIAHGIETLTQRYLEAMLSRMVIIGHCPKELSDLIGYNPCIEIVKDTDAVQEQIKNILEHIENYQPLVDKNRDTALKMGDYKIRMRNLQEWVASIGYSI